MWAQFATLVSWRKAKRDAPIELRDGYWKRPLLRTPYTIPRAYDWAAPAPPPPQVRRTDEGVKETQSKIPNHRFRVPYYCTLKQTQRARALPVSSKMLQGDIDATQDTMVNHNIAPGELGSGIPGKAIPREFPPPIPC
jgi:hypothetical protein